MAEKDLTPSSAKVAEGNGKQNIEELKKKLEDCEKKTAEYLAGWQRERADFLNYKKEEMEKIKNFLEYANEDLILKILPTLDNFEIAERKLPDALRGDENVKGILQLKAQMMDFLKNRGVEAVKAVGEKFDPNFHEVVGESAISNQQSGMIVEEMQKGYIINGRLLRPAKVKIAK